MSTIVRKKFGERIKILRKRQGISQEGLAHKANIERSYMGAIERGERNPTLEKIESIAHALKVPIQDLFS